MKNVARLHTLVDIVDVNNTCRQNHKKIMRWTTCLIRVMAIFGTTCTIVIMPSRAYLLNTIFYRRMHVTYVSSLNAFTNSGNSDIAKNLTQRPTVKKQLETNSKILFQYPDIN